MNKLKVTIISTSIILASVAVVTSVAVSNTKNIEPIKTSSVTFDGYVEPIIAVEDIPAPKVEQAPVQIATRVIEQPRPSAPVVVAPANVRSPREIAAQYPSLVNNEYNSYCFDRIVEKFPERFTEDVREQNVKALTVFASACTTGINKFKGVLEQYGENGAFFDSDMAKSTR